VAFVNELISKEDREHFKLADIDEMIFFSNPRRSWAIDRERGIFLRRLKIGLGSEPESQYESTFHFYWGGHDFIINTVAISPEELESLPGEIFERFDVNGNSAVEFYIFYVSHVSDITVASQKVDPEIRDQLLADFQRALTDSCGGVFIFARPASLAGPHQAVMKIAPRAL